MAQQEGPFSSYLDYMQKPIAPAPTGLEGTGMGIANIAMNFLQGLRQGRAQQYIRSEKEEEHKEQLLMNAMQAIQRSGMLPEVKAQYEARIQQEFAKRVAGVKEGSKDTGNPLTDFFKRAGMSLIGGQPPGGKKADLDMNVALEAFAAASDPKNSVNEALRNLDMQAGERYRQLVKEAEQSPGGVLTDVMLQSDKLMQAINNAWLRIGRPEQSPIARLARGTPSASSEATLWRLTQEKKEKELKEQAEAELKTPLGDEENIDSWYTRQVGLGQQAKRKSGEFQRSNVGFFKDTAGRLFRGQIYKTPYYQVTVDVSDPNSKKIIAGAIAPSKEELKELEPPELERRRSAAESQLMRSTLKPEFQKSFLSQIPQLLTKDDFLKFSRGVTSAEINLAVAGSRDFASNVKAQGDVMERVNRDPSITAERESGTLYRAISDGRSKYLNTYNKIQKLRAEGSPVPDAITRQMATDRSAYHTALINAAAKFTDPDSVIRPNEIKQWGDKSVLHEKWKKRAEEIQTGIEASLSKEEEESLTGMVNAMYGQIQEEAKLTKQNYFYLLKKLDVPDKVAARIARLQTDQTPESQGAKLGFSDKPPEPKKEKLRPNF